MTDLCYQAWLLCDLAFSHAYHTGVCDLHAQYPIEAPLPEPLHPQRDLMGWASRVARPLREAQWVVEREAQRENPQGQEELGVQPTWDLGLAQELANPAGSSVSRCTHPVAVLSKSERKPSRPAWRGVGGEVAARSSSAGPGCRFVTSPVSQQARTARAPPTRLPVRPPPSRL